VSVYITGLLWGGMGRREGVNIFAEFGKRSCLCRRGEGVVG